MSRNDPKIDVHRPQKIRTGTLDEVVADSCRAAGRALNVAVKDCEGDENVRIGYDQTGVSRKKIHETYLSIKKITKRTGS